MPNGILLGIVFYSSYSLSSYMSFSIFISYTSYTATTFDIGVTAILGCVFTQIKVTYVFLAK